MGLSRLDFFRLALMYHTHVKKVSESAEMTKCMTEDGFSFEEQCEFSTKMMLEALEVKNYVENGKILDFVSEKNEKTVESFAKNKWGNTRIYPHDDVIKDIKKSDLS